MTNPSPSYFAVIPAPIRYCKDLTMGARLLYGEITALCNEKGFCWATNDYFANLYQVTTRTIQSWLESLRINDFLEFHYNKDSSRKIYIKNVVLGEKNKNEKEKVESNKNTSSESYEQRAKKTSHPVKESSGGCEENFTQNNTLNITCLLVCFRKKNGKVISMPSETIHKELSAIGLTTEEIEDGIKTALKEREKQKNHYVNDILQYIKKIIFNKRKQKDAERKFVKKTDPKRKNPYSFGKQSTFSRPLSKHFKSSVHWEPEV